MRDFQVSWMVKKNHGKSQETMDDNWGYPHDLGNLQITSNNFTESPINYMMIPVIYSW